MNTGSVEAGGAELKSELQQMALQGGALVFGVADAAAFSAAPEGYRPADILPGAKSVIVLGGAKPRAGDWKSANYQHLELSSTNDRITAGCLRLAHMIEREAGFYAVAVPAGVDEGQRPFLNLALAAELAGLGTASLAGPVLNAEYGFMYFRGAGYHPRAPG
jgi:epoxyqueuosine reductase QueG